MNTVLDYTSNCICGFSRAYKHWTNLCICSKSKIYDGSIPIMKTTSTRNSSNLTLLLHLTCVSISKKFFQVNSISPCLDTRKQSTFKTFCMNNVNCHMLTLFLQMFSIQFFLTWLYKKIAYFKSLSRLTPMLSVVINKGFKTGILLSNMNI